ncbi:MAG: hypothetical protein KDC38_03730 [Planctomycetes bacterium]|nr:hypothetical protein [Planctomycetota bacterium]
MHFPSLPRISSGLIMGLVALLASTSVRAGTLPDAVLPHCGSGPVSGAFDVAYDTSNDSLWVVDQGDGIVCHYTLSSFPPLMTSAGSLSHPFGAATFPTFTPVCRGIAYNPMFDTLVILNTSASQIVQIDKITGAAAGAAVTLAASGANPPTLHGLAWDTVNNTIWSRDVANHVLREFDPLSGTEVSTIPIPVPVGDVFFGDSVHFRTMRGDRFLEIGYGDIFDGGVTRTIRLDMAGNVVGVEADLSATGETVRGTTRSPGGGVMYVCSATNVFRLTRPVPTLLAPTNMQARADNNGNMTLTWENHGPTAGAYDSLALLRDTTVIATLGGGDTTFFDSAVPDGVTVTYTLNATVGASTVSSNLAVRTGSGALVDHRRFDGASIYDVAYNPGTGNLYVSELTAAGIQGRIFVYDTDLNLVSTLNTTIDQIRGIAYDSLRDRLIVSRVGTSNLTRLNATTGATISAFTTSMSTNLGGISYDPFSDTYLVQDIAADQLYAIEADPLVVGQTAWASSPPIITGIDYAAGVCYLSGDLGATEGYAFAPVHDGSDFTVQSNQFFLQTSFPTGFQVPFESLGATVTSSPNSVRGIEDVGNVLYVCNGAVNTLFKMLLAPGGNNFIRGDANQDTLVDTSDPIFVLDYLYSGGVAPICADAADSNDDGKVDLSDALYLIFHLFQPAGLPGGSFPDPPAPFPAAGPDPTFVDPLGC